MGGISTLGGRLCRFEDDVGPGGGLDWVRKHFGLSVKLMLKITSYFETTAIGKYFTLN